MSGEEQQKLKEQQKVPTKENLFDDADDNSDDSSKEDLKNVEEKLLSDNDIYVSFPLFLEAKYGIKTILDMNKSADVKIIISNYMKSIAIEKKLRSENRISDNISEEDMKSLRSFATYPEYAGQRHVVALSLEKVILVSSKVFSGFRYERKAMSSLFIFMHYSQQYELNLKGLIIKLGEQYTAVGKVLLVNEFPTGYDEDIANVFITKRYEQAKIVVPAHLVALRTVFREKIPISKSEYTKRSTLSLLASLLADVGASIPEPTINPGAYADTKKKFSGRSIHDLEDILNLSYSKDEEQRAIARCISALLKDPEAEERLLHLLKSVDGQVESRTLGDVQAAVVGEFNPGWYSVSLSKNDLTSRAKIEYKNKLEAKFMKTSCLFFYIAYPTNYIFVESPFGRKYASSAILTQFLNVLPKMYHYLSLFIQMHIGTSAELMVVCGELATLVAEKLASKKTMQNKVRKQLLANIMLWMRDITVTLFPDVKSKYMPSRVTLDDADASDEDGDDEFLGVKKEEKVI